MIDPITAQKIKDTADIVEVVSDYVHLVRKGANYMGLCPFHNERTPSFSVNKSRNFCYCFSCHKGGSPVNFIMEKEGISYQDALKQLARKYGIEVQERELTKEEREKQSRKEGMFVASEWAKNYFVDNLFNKQDGKDIGLTYLFNRKTTPEAIKAFQLGYAIDKSNDFTEAAIRHGFSPETLKAIGLTGTNQQGYNYDKFRGRVIFPIFNSSGKTIGFGGRDLKGDSAKYINSQESEIYIKNRELYGIYQAKGAIVRENKCYLVEGYFDVISMWQAGIQNVVASSGTSLTEGQISLLHRFTENVTLIYDGDSAGIKASMRGIDMLLSHNLNVKAVPLPQGEDPDSMATKYTPEELKNYLKENETDIIRFKIKLMLDEAKGDPQLKKQAVRSIVQSIAHVADKIMRDIYVQECSILLDIKESTLSSEVAKSRFAIVEQEKLKRRTKEINHDYPDTPKEAPDSQSPAESKVDNSLFPLEHNLLINCLRFGMMTLWEPEENPQESPTTVLDYIEDELSIDNITFSHPDHKSVFEAIKEMKSVFNSDILHFKEILDANISTKRNEGQNEIRKRNLSLQEIQSEEAKLEESLSIFAKQETDTFSKNYLLDKLGSHENSQIRKIANEAMLEKHQLSSMFMKNKLSESLEENILPNIISALNILKNGIIDQKLNYLLEKLKNIGDSTDEQRSLHQQISSILQIRARMAKDIGERILCPQQFHNK